MLIYNKSLYATPNIDKIYSCHIFYSMPGNSWGNLAAPPASKDAVSPSINILYCTVLWGALLCTVVLNSIRTTEKLGSSISGCLQE